MGGVGTESPPKRGDGFWYRLDDRVYAAEELLCTVATAIMITMVFISVLWRIFESPRGLILSTYTRIFGDVPWLEMVSIATAVLLWFMLCIFAAKTANPDAGAKSAFLKGSIVAIVVICLGKLLVYLLPSGLIFSQRVALCLMMWIVMLGSSMAAYTRRHIFLQAAQKLVPEDLMKYHMALSLTFAAIFTVFLWYTSTVYALHDWEIYAKSGIMKAGVFETIPIPYWAVTVAVPIGFGLTLLRFLGTAISVLKGDVSALPEEGMIVISDSHPELDEEESP